MKSKVENFLKDKNNLLSGLLYSTLFMLLILFLPVIISLLAFIVNINISVLHFPISFILAILIILFISKKHNKINVAIISIIINVIFLTLILLFCRGLIDYSYDGVNYHLHSVISLINGWNPLKEVLETNYYADMNANFFAGKGVWYYSASIAKFLNNLNVTKSYIIISNCAAFYLVLYTILKTKVLKKMTPMYIFMFCAIMLFNPVITYQYMTNYTDVYMANLSIILLSVLMLYCTEKKCLVLDIISIISIIIMGNIKSTGLFFAFMYCLAFAIKWLIETIKTKKWKNFFMKILPFIIGGISIFIIGFNPYFTNVINGYNMFHPVFGEEKIDLVGRNCPELLRDKNNLKKIYLSITSPVNNSVEAESFSQKSPLTIMRSELSNNAFDIRLGGYGPLFQLIVWLTIIATIILLINIIIKRKKIRCNNYVYLFFAIIIISLIFPDAWWARYFPLFWILPFIIIIIGLDISKKNIYMKYFSIVLFFLMIVNNGIMFYATYTNYSIENTTIKRQLEECSNSKCYVSTTKGLFGFTITEMFDRVNSEIEFKEYLDYDWDHRAWLMATKKVDLIEKDKDINKE